MSNPRIGLFNCRTITFPQGLMNTSCSSNINPYAYAEHIENMVPSNNVAGAGNKRFGTNLFFSLPDSTENIIKLIDFSNQNSSLELILITDKGNIYSIDQSVENFQLLYSGLNPRGKINYQIFNSKLILVNGIDQPLIYDGHLIKKLKSFISQDNPLELPAFSDIFSYNDHLFALEAGAIEPDKIRPKGLYIYYTSHANNETSWHNEVSNELNYINAAGKHQLLDEFIKITSHNEYLIFFGKKKLQIWQGDNPAELGSFTFVKALPVGLAHPDLVQQFPNDLIFFTQYGIRSLTSIFESEDFKITPDIGSNIEPTVQKSIKLSKSTLENFKKCFSFQYEHDGFYGFKTPDSCLIYFISEQIKGWVIFSGIFKNINAATSTSDSKLLLAVGNKIFNYANGTDNKNQCFSDNQQPIRTIWQSKWIRSNMRMANNYFSLIFEETTNQSVYLKRKIDSPKAAPKITTIKLINSSPFWDEANWDQSNWITGKKEPVIRDKFIANSFSFTFETNDSLPGSTILAIKTLGK